MHRRSVHPPTSLPDEAVLERATAAADVDIERVALRAVSRRKYAARRTFLSRLLLARPMPEGVP